MPHSIRCRSRLPVAALAAVVLAVLAPTPAPAAPPTWPTVWEVWTDGFEGPGFGDAWEDQSEGRITIRTDAAHAPSASGLAVDLSGTDQTYLQRWHMTEWPPLEYPRDTYFRFAFDPNGATIPAGASAALLRVRDTDWNLMVGLRLTRDVAGYHVALELPDGTTDTTTFILDDDWHTIVVGVRPHDWLGLWVDDQAPRLVEGVTHAADFVQVLLLGKPDGNWSGPTPTGTVRFDDLTLLFGAYPGLWVDPAGGDDANEGNTPESPLRTLALAARLSSPGTTIHLRPGDYRESVVLPVDGTEDEPIRFVADGGRGSAHILGSEPATSTTWSRLSDPAEIDLPSGVDPGTATIWKADLSTFALEEPPTFVVLRAADGSVTRLTSAREPDERIDTPWKHHEFWWAAEGGTAVTTCEPAEEPDCDEPQRSDRWLLDYHDDPEPAGIEPGSLASLGDVTGATIFVKDNWSGHYLFRRRVAENPEPGRVRLEAFPDAYTEGCWFDHDPANPALGWHSKYFVEGLAKLLDTPGEWYFDVAGGTLYIWTPDGRSPAEVGLEFSVRDVGLDLSQRSYVELRDLDVLLFDETGIEVSNGGETDRSHGLLLAGLDVGWVRYGLELAQEPAPGSPTGVQIRGFTLRDSFFHDIETVAIAHWGGSGEDFPRPGISDVRIVHNEFARIGFRENERGGVGLSFGRADHFLFEGNHVHDIAHCGVNFSQGQTVPGNRGYDLAPDEVLTGDILVRGNLFERCVQNATDAAGLKFWGATADRSHVFRDVLVMENVSRDNVGWAWVSWRRNNWTYFGKGGMGYYIDFASGITFFRNIAWNNGLAGFMASGSWIDQPVVLANNTIAGSPLGYTLGTRGAFADAAVGLDVVNTIFLHLQRFAFSVGQDQILAGRVQLDHDLFFDCGLETWEHHTPGLMAGHVDGTGYRELPALADVQALGFEADGRVEDPHLADFDPADAWPDFRLTAASTAAIDTGGPLPASLVALLEKFGMNDGRRGAALDRGALEFDADHPDAPFTLDVGPGDGTATITTPWDDGYEDPPVPPPSGDGDSGCGCRAAGTRRSAWWLFALVGLLATRRRRRGGRMADGTARGVTSLRSRRVRRGVVGPGNRITGRAAPVVELLAAVGLVAGGCSGAPPPVGESPGGTGTVAPVSVERTAADEAVEAVVAAFGAGAAAPADGDDRDPIVDEDYRFRLDWPGSGWRLMDEEEASRLSSDALAGARQEAGIFGFVHVEALPEADLARYADLTFEVLPIEDKQLEARESLDFHGVPAMRYVVTGTSMGVSLRFVRVVWLSGGYAFQVAAGGFPEEVGPNGEGCEPFFDAFSILPGEIRARGTVRAPADTTGVGWRVLGGRFESAVHRLAITPPEGWVVVVGEPLRRMNNRAAVGLQLGQPEVYLVVLVEQVDPEQREAVDRQLRERFQETVGVELPRERTVRVVGGRDVEFSHVWGGHPSGIEWEYGIHFEQQQCMQFLAWYAEGQAETPDEQLRRALEAIRLLDATDAATLAQELEAAPDSQNQVGAQYALRRGVYRDFRFSFEWRRPAGFWRVLVGDAARVENPSASVYLEDPASGMYGMIIVENPGSFDGPAYHAAVLANLQRASTDPPFPDPSELVLGEARGLLTETRITLDGLVFDYWVATTVFRAAAVQLLVWGAPSVMQAARARADDVVEGLRFGPSRLQAQSTTDGVFHDLRLGFAVRVPEPEWAFEDRTPPPIAPIGAVAHWRCPDRALSVVGICTGHDDADVDGVRDALSESGFGPFLDPQSPGGGWEPTTFQQLPAWRADVLQGDHLTRFLVFRRDRTDFLVTAEAWNGADRTALDELLARFSLVD